MARVRMVIMTPVVYEEDFHGDPKAMGQWAQLRVTQLFDQAVESKHDKGPVEGEYWPKLMEACTVEEIDPLEEMVAPGLVA